MWATVAAVALTRIYALSRTLWDWDESLFCMALRDFDVVHHHPHPPGFPLFVALGKLLRPIAGSDFRSLQIVTLVGAVALFPLTFALAREMRFSSRVSYFGALLFAFFPNVWFFGGTAFSDVSALALTLGSCVMLLRGCRDRRAYFSGALLLGLAASMRPQALMIGCAAAIVSTWFRGRVSWRDPLIAALIGASVIVVSYGAAALASESIEGYFAAARSLRDYLRKVDSFLNPDRPAAISLFTDFFIHHIPGGKRAVAVAIAAAGAVSWGVLKRSRSVFLLLATFLPFNVFGWFMLDINSISRYAVSYEAMSAILAVEGIAVICLLLRHFAPYGTAIASIVLIGMFVVWTLPAIREVRNTISPTVAAMLSIRGAVLPSSKVYVHGSMGPYASYFLSDYDVTIVESPGDLSQAPAGAHDYLVTEGATGAMRGDNFVRPRYRLFDIARRRYFEVSVSPAAEVFEFGHGWYGEEGEGTAVWRWMGSRSTTLLPPIVGKARLALRFTIPSDTLPSRPVVEVRLNDSVVDRVVCVEGTISRSWIVDSRPDQRNTLALSIDRVVNPAKAGTGGDGRDLGLELDGYSWEPLGR